MRGPAYQMNSGLAIVESAICYIGASLQEVPNLQSRVWWLLKQQRSVGYKAPLNGE